MSSSAFAHPMSQEFIARVQASPNGRSTATATDRQRFYVTAVTLWCTDRGLQARPRDRREANIITGPDGADVEVSLGAAPWPKLPGFAGSIFYYAHRADMARSRRVIVDQGYATELADDFRQFLYYLNCYLDRAAYMDPQYTGGLEGRSEVGRGKWHD